MLKKGKYNHYDIIWSSWKTSMTVVWCYVTCLMWYISFIWHACSRKYLAFCTDLNGRNIKQFNLTLFILLNSNRHIILISTLINLKNQSVWIIIALNKEKFQYEQIKIFEHFLLILKIIIACIHATVSCLRSID